MKAEKIYVYANRYPRKKLQQDIQVGHRLKLIRLTFGLLQTDLAKRFRTTQSTIKFVENNLRRTNHKLLLQYKDLAGVTIDWILTGKIMTVGDRLFLIKARKRRGNGRS